MTGQAELLHRLTTLLQQVDSLKGEEHRDERAAASQRVEAELNALEAEVSTDVTTAAGKQQAGLIALVRAALLSDRDNESFSDWSEEGLLKAHGLTTYASQAYWDEAYADNRYGVSFDWYGTWEEPDLEGRSLAALLRPLLAPEARILMLGCGNSNMSVLMYHEGFKNIVNIDISKPVIAQMQERYGDLPGMTWRAMDATALEFADGDFDVAIEKGLFDALFAGTGTQVQPVLNEVQRVLRPGGKLLSISFSEDRMARLFMPSKEESPTEEAATMNCQVEGTLRYAKGRNRTAQHDGQAGQRFHIYGCERSS